MSKHENVIVLVMLALLSAYLIGSFFDAWGPMLFRHR